MYGDPAVLHSQSRQLLQYHFEWSVSAGADGDSGGDDVVVVTVDSAAVVVVVTAGVMTRKRAPKESIIIICHHPTLHAYCERTHVIKTYSTVERDIIVYLSACLWTPFYPPALCEDIITKASS